MPFANPVMAGKDLVRTVMESPNYVPGVSGWAIFKNGNVEFNAGTFRGVVSAGTFQGTNFIINSSGEFYYSPSIASGNLVVSISPSGGTGPFGETIEPGFTAITATGTVNVAAGVVTFTGGGQVNFSNNGFISQNTNYIVFGGVPLEILTPIFGGLDAVQPGTTATPESWHTVANPTGVTGAIRVKILPLVNLAVLDVNAVITSTSASGTSYTGGTLPSSSYYPAAARQFPLSVNQGMGTSPSIPRVSIPTSGDVVLIMPGFTTAGNSCIVSGTITYPLD